MKEKLILMIVIFSVACSSPSPEEKLIADYEQTIGNTKTDLKFKLISLQLIGEIKASDSLEIIRKETSKGLPESMRYSDYKLLYDSCSYLAKSIETTIHKMDSLFNIGGAGGDYLKRNESLTQQYEAYKSLYNGSLKVKEGMDPYINDPDKVLALKYDCKYSIENPMLNNAKQEIFKTYFFDPAIQRILATSSEK